MLAHLRQGLAGVTLLALGGCMTFGDQPPMIFTQAVEQLGITPVYPPREDIQVGDIYAVSAHTVATRNEAKTALVARDDLTPQITAYLASRYKFADTQTTNTSGGAVLSLKLLQNDARGRRLIPGRSDLETLPIDGFPVIDYNTGVTIGAQGQPQNLAAVFGFEAAKTLHMSLQFDGVTSYEVPIPDGLDALHNYCILREEICQTHFLTNWLNQKYQLGAGDPGHVDGAGVMMITKVYLARQITFTFNDATLAAAAAASVSASGTAAPAAPTVSPAAVDAAAKSDDPMKLLQLVDLQKELNASLANQGGPGGRASFAGFSDTGVSFHQIFARPIVIGYEAVSIQGR